jgi:hypothetical protein
LAEWADTAQGFDAPEVTAKSLNAGRISYRGTIPPDALKVVTMASEGAQIFHDGVRQTLNLSNVDLAPPPLLGFYKTEVARAVELARSVIASAAQSVGEPYEQLLPDWLHPEHATSTRDLLINARRAHSRAGEWRAAEVLHAARLVADSVPHLQPELGWSSTRDACLDIAQAAVGVVRSLREQVGEESALTAAQAAVQAVTAVVDLS